MVGEPERSILQTWDQYPLQVFLPDSVNGSGLDLKTLSQQAVDKWNELMGEPYFAAASDSASASTHQRSVRNGLAGNPSWFIKFGIA